MEQAILRLVGWQAPGHRTSAPPRCSLLVALHLFKLLTSSRMKHC